MENRYIELIAIAADNNFIYFKIGKQTHRVDDFSSSGRSFKASNGILLKSLVSPEYDPTFNTLFVKGMDELRDNSILKCNHAVFYLICEAITEYNKTNGVGYVKESILNHKTEQAKRLAEKIKFEMKVQIFNRSRAMKRFIYSFQKDICTNYDKYTLAEKRILQLRRRYLAVIKYINQ